MARKIVYRALGVLWIVAVFVVGVWLGRLYSDVKAMKVEFARWQRAGYPVEK